MLKLQNIFLKNGNFELKDINLHIKKGTVCAILGPSGAGKSTILNAILGLKRVNSGTILLKDNKITNLAVEKRGFGYVPQNLALFPHMSVKDNILYGVVAQNRSDELFEYITKAVNVTNFLTRYPKSLSGGEKQRVALARAFVTKPELLLLDEPFNALDIKLKKELWQLLKAQANKFDTTVVMVTHDLNEAYYLADTIAVVINGKVAQFGSKEDIFNNPASLEVAKYLGISNIYSGVAKKDNCLYVKDFAQNLQCAQNLQQNQEYTVAIRNKDISFVDSMGENVIQGDYRVAELEFYDIVTFEIKNTTQSNINIEFIVSKECKKTNYVYIPPDNIICYKK